MGMRAWFRPGAERFGNGNVGAPLRRQYTGCFLQSNSSSLTSVGSPVLASERAPEHGSGGGMLVRR